jgi:hypothetical protein
MGRFSIVERGFDSVPRYDVLFLLPCRSDLEKRFVGALPLEPLSDAWAQNVGFIGRQRRVVLTPFRGRRFFKALHESFNRAKT